MFKLPNDVINYMILPFLGFTDFIYFSQTCKEARMIARKHKPVFVVLTPGNMNTFDYSSAKSVVLLGFRWPRSAFTENLPNCEHLCTINCAFTANISLKSIKVWYCNHTDSISEWPLLKLGSKDPVIVPELEELYVNDVGGRTTVTIRPEQGKCSIRKVICTEHHFPGIIYDIFESLCKPMIDKLCTLVIPQYLDKCMTAQNYLYIMDRVDRKELEVIDMRRVTYDVAKIHAQQAIERHHNIPEPILYGLPKDLIIKWFLPWTYRVKTEFPVKTEFLT